MKLLKNHWFFNVFSIGRRKSSDQKTFIYKAILNMKLLKNHWFFNGFHIATYDVPNSLFQLAVCNIARPRGARLLIS